MTYLNYDANGFIVGVNRMNEGIDKVHDDTQTLIQLLTSQRQIADTRMRELTRAVKTASYRASSQSSINTNRARISDSAGNPVQSLQRQASGQNNPASNSSRASNNSSTDNSNDSTISRTSSSAADRAPSNRPESDSTRDGTSDSDRDGSGRFTAKSKTAAALNSMGNGIKSVGQGNVSGVDPVLDSIRETKDLLSPLTATAKLAGRGVKFSLSKMKARKRREPISNQQDRHNSENEKILDKIWKAIRKNNGGGGGLGGGLLGGGGGRRNRRNRRRGRRSILGRARGLAGKALRFGGGVPAKVIAGAVGTYALAKSWGGLDQKEKSEGVGRQAGGMAGMTAGAVAGGTVGSVVPFVGTVIGGLIGGGLGYWLGSEGGEVIGGAASPHIESWTKTLIGYNLPDKMSDTWNKGIKPFFTKMDEMAGKLDSWIKEKAGDASSFAGGLADIALDGLGLGDDGLGSLSAKYEGKVGSANPDNKGWAYGRYQFNSATGGLDQFFKDNPDYAEQFAGMKPSSEGFNQKWRNIAATDGENFGKAQDKSAAKLWYAPAAASAKEKGFKMDDRGVQEAIFSGSIQHGGIKKVIKSASNQKGFADMTAEQQIEAFYKSRRAYARKNVKPSVMKGLDKRYDNELKDAKELSRSSAQKAAAKETIKNAVTQKQPDSKEVEGSVASTSQPNNSALGVSMGGMTADKDVPASTISKASATPMIFKSSSPVPASEGYAPTNFPSTPVMKIPKMPTVKQRLDSGSSDKPIVMQSSSDGISQNLSDRGLAHAVTGGFGQERFWG